MQMSFCTPLNPASLQLMVNSILIFNKMIRIANSHHEIPVVDRIDCKPENRFLELKLIF